MGPIGIQLYTLRTLMEEDLPGTLEQVATIGYQEVEFAGYFGYEAAEIRSILDSLGLRAPAAHTSLEDVRERPDALIEAGLTLGHEYWIVASVNRADRGSLDAYRAHADTLNRVGERFRAAGLTVGYHNHEYEFEVTEGLLPYDILLSDTDPDLVAFEMDLFWIREGGGDPHAYFDRHPGRFRLCHVKDMAADGTMVDVGDGVIPFAEVFRAADQAGLDHYFVEHDNPDDPLASAARSYAHLANLVVAP